MEIIKNSTESITVKFYENDTLIDLTGKEVKLIVKKDTDSEILINKSVFPTGSEAVITLNPDDTSNLEVDEYVYQLSLIDGETIMKTSIGNIYIEASL